jgi:TonB-dependent receptor
VFLVASVAGFAQSGGRLSVNVSNQGTNEYLQKARVEILGTNRVENTDELGVAVFTGVPPGEYRVRVSYVGLADRTYPVTIAAGRGAELSAELLDQNIVQLEVFVVAEEREGNAASQVRQKNADNLTHVIATDALGMLANDNPADILTRMPGIYSLPSTEGNSDRPTIRGMSGEMNAVTTDGGEMASGLGMTRSPVFTNIVASAYDEIEVTKANRPDQPAGSISGSINFKTKSGLTMKRAGHEFTYRVGGKWWPGFFDYSTRRDTPPFVPNLTFGYRGLFDVLGKKRNLGVVLNFAYLENGTQRVQPYAYLDVLNTDGTNTPRFSTNYYRYNNMQDRQLAVGSVRLDYKLSSRSRFTLNYEWKKQDQNFDNPDHFNIYTYAYIDARNRIYGASETTAGFIAPSSTLEFTKVNAATNNRTYFRSYSSVFIASDKTDSLRFAGNHRPGSWEIDYNINYSRSTRKVGGGGEDYDHVMISNVNAYIYNIGWTLDRRKSDVFPKFTQTEGQSIYDINSYTYGNASANHGDSKNELGSARVNLARTVTLLGLPVRLSTGGVAARSKYDENRHGTTFYYVGEDGVRGTSPVTGLNDDNFALFQTWAAKDARLEMGDVPVFDIKAAESSIRNDPRLWRVNAYNEAYARLEGIRSAEETSWAAFVQAQAHIGRLGIITGVRMETTDVETSAWVKERARPDLSVTDAQGWVTPESAQRRVAEEYGRINGTSSYTEYFPSLHLRYALTRDTIVRASWSTAMGRPQLSRIMPGATDNSDTMRVTFGNPALKPQYATSYDVSIEHYYKPMGMLTLGVFQKDLADFTYAEQITADDMDENGMVLGLYDWLNYEELYPDYDFFRYGNGRTGRIRGVEVAWEQQFTFLPSYFSGLSLSANYTRLKTSADYGAGGSAALTSFIPNTANIRLSFKLHRFYAFVQWAYMDRYLATYDSNPQRRVDVLERSLLNVGVSFKLGRHATLAVTANNILDAPQRQAHHVTGHRLTTIYNGPFVTVGLNGRF